jgi:hypothetical protein
MVVVLFLFVSLQRITKAENEIDMTNLGGMIHMFSGKRIYRICNLFKSLKFKPS